jgi:hypothetical protein
MMMSFSLIQILVSNLGLRGQPVWTQKERGAIWKLGSHALNEDS